MISPSFLRQKVTKRGELIIEYINKYRSYKVTPERDIVIEGRGSQKRALLAISDVLNIVEMVEIIFGYLSYRDLQCAYYVCKGLQRVVDGSDNLRKNLFRMPDYECLDDILPTKIFSQWPSGYLFERPTDHRLKFFSVSTHTFNRLYENPNFQVLTRLLAQPPLQYLEFELEILNPHHSEKHMKYGTNKDCITLGDFVSSIKTTTARLSSAKYPFWTARGFIIRFQFADRV
jgi:hypothetical protein